MALDPAADLAAILARQDLTGVTVAATVGAGPATIDGVVSSFYTEVQGVSTEVAALAVASAAVASNSIVFDSQVTFGGVTYKVKDVRPSGWGLSLLVLEEQS